MDAASCLECRGRANRAQSISKGMSASVCGVSEMLLKCQNDRTLARFPGVIPWMLATGAKLGPTIQSFKKNQVRDRWRHQLHHGSVAFSPSSSLWFRRKLGSQPARQESESPASNMEAPSFPQLSFGKEPAGVNFFPSNFEYIQ